MPWDNDHGFWARREGEKRLRTDLWNALHFLLHAPPNYMNGQNYPSPECPSTPTPSTNTLPSYEAFVHGETTATNIQQI